MFYIDEGEKIVVLIGEVPYLHIDYVPFSIGNKRRQESIGICGDSCIHGESIELWKKERLSMWNAEIYNRYGKERIQPSIDLVGRIREMKFQRILDVGCGTGMSTAPLVSAWENAEIIGIDMSKEMLEKAREILPTVTFIQRDCSKPLLDVGSYDLIFSNAFVQWLPNQKEFVTNAFAMLNENGIFAAQIHYLRKCQQINVL